MGPVVGGIGDQHCLLLQRPVTFYRRQPRFSEGHIVTTRRDFKEFTTTRVLSRPLEQVYA